MIQIKGCEPALPYQRCPSPDLKQNASLRQLAELCYANQQKHNPVYQYNLLRYFKQGKRQRESIAKV